MNTNEAAGIRNKGYSTKKLFIIIIIAFAVLALIWILIEARANKPDVPPSGTVGQVLDINLSNFRG